jgi:hypothetical protein
MPCPIKKHGQYAQAFIDAELSRYRVETATFDAAGRVTWAQCKDPGELTRSTRPLSGGGGRPRGGDNLEATTDAAGKVTWSAPMVVPAEAEPHRLTKLRRWLDMAPAAREPFLTRAARHIPEWDRATSLEYGAYYLFARGRQHPLTRPEYFGFKRAMSRRGPTRTKKVPEGGSKGGTFPPLQPIEIIESLTPKNASF